MINNVLCVGDPIEGWYPYNREAAAAFSEDIPEEQRVENARVCDRLQKKYLKEAQGNIALEHKRNEARKVVPDSYEKEDHYQSVTFNYLNFQALLNYIHQEGRCHNRAIDGHGKLAEECGHRTRCSVVHRYRYNIRVGAYLRLACKLDHERFFPLTLGEYGPWCYLKDRPDETEDLMKGRD